VQLCSELLTSSQATVDAQQLEQIDNRCTPVELLPCWLAKASSLAATSTSLIAAVGVEADTSGVAVDEPAVGAVGAASAGDAACLPMPSFCT
jgi:hypothetical protein